MQAIPSQTTKFLEDRLKFRDGQVNVLKELADNLMRTVQIRSFQDQTSAIFVTRYQHRPVQESFAILFCCYANISAALYACIDEVYATR